MYVCVYLLERQSNKERGREIFHLKLPSRIGHNDWVLVSLTNSCPGITLRGEGQSDWCSLRFWPSRDHTETPVASRSGCGGRQILRIWKLHTCDGRVFLQRSTSAGRWFGEVCSSLWHLLIPSRLPVSV